jgi:hypothetical protein
MDIWGDGGESERAKKINRKRRWIDCDKSMSSAGFLRDFLEMIWHLLTFSALELVVAYLRGTLCCLFFFVSCFRRQLWICVAYH